MKSAQMAHGFAVVPEFFVKFGQIAMWAAIGNVPAHSTPRIVAGGGANSTAGFQQFLIAISAAAAKPAVTE